MPLKFKIYLIHTVTLSHGGSVFPNFLPIIGCMIKIENFLYEVSEIFVYHVNYKLMKNKQTF